MPVGHTKHIAEAIDNPDAIEAVKEVLKERGKTYGQFIDNASLGQELKAVIRNHYNWAYLAADQKQMIDVIFDKISRIVTGDPTYLDNYLDIEGYARLVRERLTK